MGRRSSKYPRLSDIFNESESEKYLYQWDGMEQRLEGRDDHMPPTLVPRDEMLRDIDDARKDGAAAERVKIHLSRLWEQVEAHKRLIYGNGSAGLRTYLAIMDKRVESLEKAGTVLLGVGGCILGGVCIQLILTLLKEYGKQ